MRLRIQLTKDSSIRFIAHLEYVRTLSRALRRAKLPVAYSEGFNPHLKFSLASALGVGLTSDAEFAEIELTELVDLQPAMQRLAAALPRGMRIRCADIAEQGTPKLMALAAGADYEAIVPAYGDCTAAVGAFNQADTVAYTKAAPKLREKVKHIDVKDYISQVSCEQEGEQAILRFSCKIMPQGSMKAVELLQVLKESFQAPLILEKADVRRTDLYGKDKLGRKKPLLQAQYWAL